ncbi:hypothetical protein H7J08_23070 [Mycobacterium frederiksbergense]|uniref:hypothetical protein n=1 Tax=Mycolicibacterium frederiksbergense TaxID=117567 RepID=UPI0021F3BD70|nr:hypothetical protein [Mycolicibacterium frederiksbergense]MCV7047519.1 hypothetical protein [Mycolicibacterium frederiksbergense]
MSDPQTRLSLADGSWVELGPVLAKAGEGTIYGLAHRANLVAKVFHPDIAHLDEKLAKVTAMVGTDPPGAVQADGFVVLAWPQQMLYRDDAPVGFLMPRIDTSQAVEIHSLSNPSNRASPLPTAPQWTAATTWTHLVTAAANLCLAVDVVHHVDAVIGDFQERNILVANTVRVTLVDCDSMQFTDQDSRQFLSPLGRPEFTAPELAKADLRTNARDTTSDLFALAVHIHLLIMAGNHPFLRGAWTGPGDQPDALSLAGQGSWAGGPGSLLHRHPLAPPVSFLPSEIQALFVRAFTNGARDPGARPSAEEWRLALSHIQITTCHLQPQHQIPVGTDVCPWCDIEATRLARRAGGPTARPAQVAMPPLGSQPVAAAPPQTPLVATGAPGSGSGRNWWLLWGLLGIFVVVAGVLIVIAGFGGNASERTATTATVPHESWSYPTTTRPITPSPIAPTLVQTTPPQPSSWQLVIVGTCDEGGTCGVKQRNAPYTAAERLVRTDLQDGTSVSVVCQTVGDIRSSDGRSSSSVWYRLENGAYVASVYMNATPTGVPSC